MRAALVTPSLFLAVVNRMSSVRPLSRIVVIEIGHSIAAPYAGMILGELGAEVIKLEYPRGGGGPPRRGPPLTGSRRALLSSGQAGKARHPDLPPRPRRCGAAAQAD